MLVSESEAGDPADTTPGHEWTARLRTNMKLVGGSADAVERSPDGDVRVYDLLPHVPEDDEEPESSA